MSHIGVACEVYENSHVAGHSASDIAATKPHSFQAVLGGVRPREVAIADSRLPYNSPGSSSPVREPWMAGRYQQGIVK